MSQSPIPLGPLSVLTRTAVIVLAAGLVSEKALQMQKLPLDIGDPSHNVWMIPAFWVGILAPAFYLCALWAASNVFDRMARGDAFGPAMVKGLKEVGSNLLYGAAAAIFIAPSLVFLIETGFHRMAGVKYHFEIESLTIGAIGLVLYLLARQGQTLKSELDQIV